MKPGFLGEPGRRHFMLQFVCTGTPKAHIVYLPPFGEEMNRCRAAVAEQARQFAAMGYSCILIDFYGTGDSEGAAGRGESVAFGMRISGPPSRRC
ncbi:MAG: hypothetical protein U5K56_05590 [Halioglobus sp.]|nr:hypothetical protein [Halioglobus sp.]